MSAARFSCLLCDETLVDEPCICLQAVTLPSGAAAILSDTVGFISDLPVQLLDAFKVWRCMEGRMLQSLGNSAKAAHSAWCAKALPAASYTSQAQGLAGFALMQH